MKKNALSTWLVLNRIKPLSETEIQFFVQHIDECEEEIIHHPKKLETLGFSQKTIEQIQHIDWKQIERELLWAEQKSHYLVTLFDEQYPKMLREISSPPLVLFVSGNVECIDKWQLAIVGSRNSSPTGREIAYEFSKNLAQSGFIITSGLALGIDGASHRGALESGKTIAVLGTGLDCIYPSKHRELAEQIEQNGALVSEFPLQTPACSFHFPLRNRIISGLSFGVLVIEASIRSGSLITAKYAVEHNRNVYAIPGSIRHHLAKGCHQLIKQGAKLVETPWEIIEDYNFLTKTVIQAKKSTQKITLDPIQKKILSSVGHELTSIDTILIRTGTDIQHVSATLVLLELQGHVKSAPGGYYKL